MQTGPDTLSGFVHTILSGRFFRTIILPALALILGMKFLLLTCVTYVGPNEYGIKVVRVPLLSSRGVHKQVYTTGFHLVLKPFNIEQMYPFPKDVQVIDFTGSREEAAREAELRQPAHIQTSDGFFVDVDVSILYKVADPYLVFTRLGAGRLFESNGIIPKAEPILKQALGELNTEEFYNSPLRFAKSEMAKELLNRDLAPYGLQVDQALVRYFHYSEEIQKNIEERKLKDQLVFKNQAEARAATEEAKLKKMMQEGEATVAIKLQEGQAYMMTKNAEKDLYARKKRAEADLLIKLAEAKKTQLRNEALQGAGSSRMVGLKMAEVYKGVELIVLPSDGAGGINPLNLEQTMKLLNVKE
ncbi:MAG: SPFH domain-containing protein [Deltaproteobacteria bacterium]|nr:SPFH domain-containing protein [Deltaproteobacteria bacterium]